MRLFYSFFLAATCVGWLAACSPQFAPPTQDTASAALPPGTPYALLHFYRPGKFVGSFIGYDIHVGDTVIYRAQSGFRGQVRRSVSGPVTLWAKTEAREELVLNVEKGREYYILCTVGAGVAVGRPHMRQVSIAQGRKESEGLTSVYARPVPTK